MVSILIVEDDPVVRETMADILWSAGYRDIALAADGVIGLEMMRASPRRLVVLLDVIMPRKSGFEVLTDVMDDDALASRHVFVIVTAGSGFLLPAFAVNRTAALNAAIPMLVKPFRRAELLQAVAVAERRMA
jgi:CheY-like chemotaxis protein